MNKQVQRICKKCGNVYTVDIDDEEPLCHECYIKKYEQVSEVPTIKE